MCQQLACLRWWKVTRVTFIWLVFPLTLTAIVFLILLFATYQAHRLLTSGLKAHKVVHASLGSRFGQQDLYLPILIEILMIYFFQYGSFGGSVGGGQLPELRDSIVCLPVFHSGILSLSLSLLALSFSLFQLRFGSLFLNVFCRTTHTLQNDNDITFLSDNSFAHSEWLLFSRGINNMDFVLFQLQKQLV